MSVRDIKELMRLREWSQADLARALEMTEGAVSRWINEGRCPTGGTRQLIMQWLREARENKVAQPA